MCYIIFTIAKKLCKSNKTQITFAPWQNDFKEFVLLLTTCFLLTCNLETIDSQNYRVWNHEMRQSMRQAVAMDSYVCYCCNPIPDLTFFRRTLNFSRSSNYFDCYQSCWQCYEFDCSRYWCVSCDCSCCFCCYYSCCCCCCWCYLRYHADMFFRCFFSNFPEQCAHYTWDLIRSIVMLLNRRFHCKSRMWHHSYTMNLSIHVWFGCRIVSSKGYHLDFLSYHELLLFLFHSQTKKN